ncbi:MAG: phosphoribosylanthranilate isomerase [Clostridia bacterium]
MSRVRIKICGVTRPEDALACARAGADMIGLNFYPNTPRHVKESEAQAIVADLDSLPDNRRPLLIGVFVDETPERIGKILEGLGLDGVQFSGDEPPGLLDAFDGLAYLALRPRDPTHLSELLHGMREHRSPRANLPGALLDAHHAKMYGGTGETVGEDLIVMAQSALPRLMLAGGLRPDNVGAKVRTFHPWGVDVASGVEGETPGIKDSKKISEFIASVRGAEGSDGIAP